MATENVTQGAKPPLSNAGAVASLNNCDALAQYAAESIVALTRATQNMLSMDADALLVAHDLFGQIEKIASDLSDTINSEAGSHGANYTNERRDNLVKNLFGQQANLERRALARIGVKHA